MIPTLPSKFPQMLLALGISLLFLGYLTFRLPFDTLNSLADREADLIKSSNLDEAAYRLDSINLIYKQNELINKSTIIAQKSPDSLRLMMELNSQIAGREIDLHEFYQKHRPQYHAMDIQGYIDGEIHRTVIMVSATTLFGITFWALGFFLCFRGLKLSYREYKNEKKLNKNPVDS